MNCDYVFDVLTRGPFPSGGRDDAAVQTHLGGCPSCRRLAEALRPALELFQESVSVEESYDLPGYWGEFDDAPADAQGDLATARAVDARATSPQGLVSRARWLGSASAWPPRRIAAATMMIAGVVLVAFAAYYGEVETSTDSEPVFPLSQAFAPDGTRNPHPATLLVRRPSKAQWNELAAMLRPACLDHVGGGSALIAIGPDENAVPSVLLADSGQLCCNDCHRRAANEPSHEAMSLQIAMACSACHQL